MSLRFYFAWYDLWVGAYWDRSAMVLYVMPFPMLGVEIAFRNSDPNRLCLFCGKPVLPGGVCECVFPP